MAQLSEEQQALQERMKNMSPEELRELQKQQCVFCQIISGKIPSKKIYEDAQSLAIMDINPAAQGHVLVLPKEHYGIMPQMPDDLLAHLMVTAKRLSQVMLKVLRVSGTTIFVANGLAAGQKAPHVMIHVIPRKEGDGLFSLQPQVVDSTVLRQIAVAVEQKFNAIMGIKKQVVDAGETVSAVENKASASAEEPGDVEEEPAMVEKSSETIEVVPELPIAKSKPKGRTAVAPESAEEPVPPEKKSSSSKPQKSTKGASKGRSGRATEPVSLDDIASLFK